MNTKWLKKIKHFFDNKALVLMYHRIANLLFDPFELGVSPENFQEQLQVLKKNFKVIPVNELLDHLDKNSISSKSVCITFDDGYADNYFIARPLLKKYQCPATFYIASSFIGKEQLFWWDELQEILLNTPQLPPKLSIAINGELVEWSLENEGVLTKEQWQKQRGWLFLERPFTQRCELFITVWKHLKPLPHVELHRVMRKLRSWAGLNQPFGMNDLPMTVQQLHDISSESLFDLGLHTCTHPSLSLHKKDIQFQEIAECKDCLEKKYSKRLHTISYPYGDYNEETLSIVKGEKLKGAFTTDECLVTNRTDPYRIGRFQVKNWSGGEFEKRLNNWFHRS